MSQRNQMCQVWSHQVCLVLVKQQGICDKELVLGQFRSQKAYQDFVEDYDDYAKKLKNFEHLVLEELR